MLEPNKLMTWDEMKKEFPDRWVIVQKTKGNPSTIKEGIVKYVATDDEVSEIWIRCLDENLGYYRERTTIDYGLGIIDCINLEVDSEVITDND